MKVQCIFSVRVKFQGISLTGNDFGQFVSRVLRSHEVCYTGMSKTYNLLNEMNGNDIRFTHLTFFGLELMIYRNHQALQIA